MQLFNGDCLEVLRGLPDNCIDLVVTDPPYILETKGGGIGKDMKMFDEIEGITSGFNLAILDELERVQKATNIYLFCSKNELPAYLNYYLPKGYKYDLLTWHKTNGAPLCGDSYMPDTEYLLFFKKPGVKIYGTPTTKKKYYVTPRNVKDKERYEHPTIKPLEIIENLVINSSIRGGCVLDPFMGSGTTGAACKKLGREFVGIEIDPHYFEIAKKRIEETGENVPEIAEQMKLF